LDKHSDSHAYFDVKHLQLLDVLYLTRSVTKTAEHLGLPQPTVSVWLKQIRKKLGDPLFIRTSREMFPTPRAELVVKKAREILESMRQICDDVPSFDPSTANRTFRICMPDSGHLTLMPQLIEHIRMTAPQVRIETLSVDQNTAQHLESGYADLAYGGFVSGMDTTFHQKILVRQQDFICLASKRHPRIQDTLSFADYQREAHVAVIYSGSLANSMLKSALQAKKIERREVVTFNGALGVGKVIAASDLIATLPRQIGTILAEINDLQLLKCPIPIPCYEVRQFWHSRFHRDPGNQWLRNLITRLV
jgi:DNA-binding transcriptional LysR family regulator